MDIKDSNREAFELVVANQLQNSLYHSVFFNEATGYDCADDAPAGVQVFCCGLNSDWRIWKAAKAQAVPDGFVVVNKKELAKVLNCVTDNWLIDTDSVEEFKKIESLVQDVYVAMIEAQEPTND